MKDMGIKQWGIKGRRARGSAHICILDDEEAIVFTLTRLMRGFGYSSAGFSNPRDARIGMEHRAPDLLICDIAMPEISGIEFAIQATEQFPSCKVLLFSARTDAHELVEDMAQHGYSFEVAMKPLHPEELMKRVGQLLGPRQPDGQPRQAERQNGRRPSAAFGLSPRIWEV